MAKYGYLETSIVRFPAEDAQAHDLLGVNSDNFLGLVLAKGEAAHGKVACITNKKSKKGGWQ